MALFIKGVIFHFVKYFTTLKYISKSKSRPCLNTEYIVEIIAVIKWATAFSVLFNMTVITFSCSHINLVLVCTAIRCPIAVKKNAMA